MEGKGRTGQQEAVMIKEGQQIREVGARGEGSGRGRSSSRYWHRDVLKNSHLHYVTMANIIHYLFCPYGSAVSKNKQTKNSATSFLQFERYQYRV